MLYQSANKGYTPAIYKYGTLLYDPVNAAHQTHRMNPGRNRDRKEVAFEYYLKAFEKGHEDAGYALAIMALDPKLRLDPHEISPEDLLRELSSNGHDKATIRLSTLLRENREWSFKPGDSDIWRDHADDKELRALYRKAAKRGDAESAERYAHALWGGLGGDTEPGNARKWFERSAKNGNQKASIALAAMWLSGDGGKQDPQRATTVIASSDLEAEDLASAYLEIGLTFRRLEVASSDPEHRALAIEYFRKGADAGSAGCMYELGVLADQEEWMSSEGHHLAAQWMRHAKWNGNLKAHVALGAAHEYGWWGLKRDLWKAKLAYKEAEKLGANFAGQAYRRLAHVESPANREAAVARSSRSRNDDPDKAAKALAGLALLGLAILLDDTESRTMDDSNSYLVRCEPCGGTGKHLETNIWSGPLGGCTECGRTGLIRKWR